MVLSLGWMNIGNAGYCIGGSQAIIRLIEEEIAALGGAIRFKTKVERVVVENDVAVGAQITGGETIKADWVISAADGHATLFEMLGGKYVDRATQEVYEHRDRFASYLQVSLGVALDLHNQPPGIARILNEPIMVDRLTELSHLSFRFFHFDPTFAPEGKTAVTCILPTRDFDYWNDLRHRDIHLYREEKQRVAEEVITVLERMVPGVREAIEVVDVSTPATVARYTGNWQGSMEGWLVGPGQGFRPFPNTLPGLQRFLMVGQWVMPGGGLPSGPMTARPALKAICKHDHVPFDVHAGHAARPEPVGA
jgi:phytoene dehydrogenase-like protein